MTDKRTLRAVERLLADICLTAENQKTCYTEAETIEWYQGVLADWQQQADSLRWAVAELYGGDGQIFGDALIEGEMIREQSNDR